LADGSCGLSDGSKGGGWRLSTVKALQSLIDFAFSGPALSNAAGTGQWTEGNAFSGVRSTLYWSSTTTVWNTEGAWVVSLDTGETGDEIKSEVSFV
jgi:Protein of unknown function (DUF1566)